MDTQYVSKSYFTATSRVNDLMTELYEDLHDYKGRPILDVKQVTDKINAYKRVVRTELELIKSAVEQYEEDINRK
tara:strand:- start:2020 stop:2244 length:225 start_codon:yes stop_codon:yes gene_type:complete